MTRHLFLLLFLCCRLLSFATDFDVVVVGTSPICLLEALYRHHLGNRVLIIDEADRCGGAWKSIDICGVAHADLGCHFLGSDQNVLTFLEDYVGCKMVSLDKPELSFNPAWSPNGYYPSKGCHEMISKMVDLIHASDIVLLLNHHVDSIYVDPDEPVATVKAKDKQFTTSKVVVTPYTGFVIENIEAPQKSSQYKYYHLYLLIDDATAPRFSYKGSIGQGIMRMMNLTPFVELEGTGMQLVVLQTNQNASPAEAEKYFNRLKNEKYLDATARLVQFDTYTYTQSQYNQSATNKVKNASQIFEKVSTSAFREMSSHISKWKQAMPLYQYAIAE
jgi:hypothetical protein